MVGSVEETSLNKDQDLQQGVCLYSIDGNIKYFDEFEALASGYKGQTVNATCFKRLEN